MVILVVIFIFAFTTYATSNILGSPGKVYDLLLEAASRHPVDGNAGGSYLTMRSKEGAIFFVINIVGNFGTVFLDNGYYNKAIAASPVSALPGYVLGGLSWFAIPWLAATTMGLACLALENHPSFPTYPNRMPIADVNAGLVLPNAAVAMLGQGGAACTLLLIFMAVTSASSAELIAVSSIFTYDLYQVCTLLFFSFPLNARHDHDANELCGRHILTQRRRARSLSICPTPWLSLSAPSWRGSAPGSSMPGSRWATYTSSWE